MNIIKSNYKLIKKIKDAKFDIDHLHHYQLLVQIGVRDLQVAVIDTSNNAILLLEDYALAAVKNYEEQQAMLKHLFEEHHLLMVGFWKEVKVCIKNKRFSLVPSYLFEEDVAQDYLRLNANVNTSKEVVLHYQHSGTDATCVFAMSKSLVDWLKGLYPNAEVNFIHQSSALIEGTMHAAHPSKPDGVFLYVDRFKLHVTAINDGALEYYNQFTIKQFGEYIQYIMLVLNGLKRSQKTTDITILGYVGKKSPHFNEFKKFIRHLSLGERPDFLNYGFVFDELQDHHFFDLYSMHLCA